MSSETFSNSGNTLGWLQDPLDLAGARSGAAANASQTHAADEANATTRYMYDTQRADAQPWREAGTSALSQLSDPNFGKDLTMDPGYQFRLDEGNKAINAAAASRGMGNSGATLKSLTKYGQDYATGAYDDAYNRQYNRLSGIAGIGNSSNQALGAQGTQAASQIANTQIGLGNAQAANTMAAAGNKNSLIGTGIGTAGSIIAKYSDERLKTDIEPCDSEAFLDSLKNFKYDYKNPEKFGRGKHFGPMAQDIEKTEMGSSLVINTEDGKAIDIGRAVLAALGAIGEINARLKRLESNKQ